MSRGNKYQLVGNILLVLVLLTGCNDASRSPDGASPRHPANVPADHLSNTVKTEKRASRTADITVMNKAIERFYIQEGRFPKDLPELVELRYLPRIPQLSEGASWNYDTNTGIATIQKDEP